MVEQAKQSRRFFSMRIPSWWLTLPLLLVMVLVGCTVGARLAWFDAYQPHKDVTGKGLGKLVSLGELNWKPYEKSIRKLEGGPPPLDRKMITPRDLAKAVELKLVTSHGVKIE